MYILILIIICIILFLIISFHISYRIIGGFTMTICIYRFIYIYIHSHTSICVCVCYLCGIFINKIIVHASNEFIIRVWQTRNDKSGNISIQITSGLFLISAIKLEGQCNQNYLLFLANNDYIILVKQWPCPELVTLVHSWSDSVELIEIGDVWCLHNKISIDILIVEIHLMIYIYIYTHTHIYNEVKAPECDSDVIYCGWCRIIYLVVFKPSLLLSREELIDANQNIMSTCQNVGFVHKFRSVRCVSTCIHWLIDISLLKWHECTYKYGYNNSIIYMSPFHIH